MKYILFLFFITTLFTASSQNLKNLDQKFGFKHVQLGKHIQQYPEFSRVEEKYEKERKRKKELLMKGVKDL